MFAVACCAAAGPAASNARDAAQAKHVKDRLQAWAGEQQRILCDIDDGVMLGINLLAGREQPAVIEDVIGQLRTIGALIRGGPTQAP